MSLFGSLDDKDFSILGHEGGLVLQRFKGMRAPLEFGASACKQGYGMMMTMLLLLTIATTMTITMRRRRRRMIWNSLLCKSFVESVAAIKL